MNEFDNPGNNGFENEENENEDVNIEEVTEEFEYNQKYQEESENTEDMEDAEDMEDTSDSDEIDEPVSDYEDENTEVYEDDVTEQDEEYDGYDDSYKIKKERFVWLKSYVADKIYEFNQLNKKQKTTRVTVFSIIFVLVILIMTDIIPILPNSYNRSYVGNEYVLGETITSDVEKFGDGVLYASSGSVICFGPDMKVENKISAFQGSNLINTNGKSAVVYSKNGNNILVMKNKDKYESITIDENIYSAKVTANAGYILLTSEAGYKSCLSAYSSSHDLVYEWHTNSNVIDMAFSDNEKYIVVSTLEYSKTGINTKLVFIETVSNTPVSECVIEEQLISELFFTQDNTVIAVGDVSTYCFTATGHQKWEIKYEGKNLKTYDYDDGKIAFLFNKYNSELSESTIEIYGLSGRLRGKYESVENIRALSLNNGYCLLQLSKGTALLDDDADLKKKKELKEDYQKTILFDNYNFAFGIRDNIAEIISVRH